MMSLREARERFGLSLREFAWQMDISAGHVSHVERGERTVSPDLADRWAAKLGVDRDAVFGPPPNQGLAARVPAC